MGVNAPPTLTPWWRYSASGIDMKLGDDQETVPNCKTLHQSLCSSIIMIMMIIIIIIITNKNNGCHRSFVAAWPLITIQIN